MTTMTDPLVDRPDRDFAEQQLGQSVFLAAGAGTGKSTTLVSRIIATLLRDDLPTSMREIVAITFTDKAGAELRHRLREELEKQCAEPNPDSRLQTALLELDTAQVGTIHSFAKGVLRRFALEAGLPLGFEIVADVEAAQARQLRAKDVVGTLKELRRVDRTLRLYQVKLNSLLELINALDAASLRIGPAALDPSNGAFTEQLRSRALGRIGSFLLRVESDCINEQDRLFQQFQAHGKSLMNMLGASAEEELAMQHLLRDGKKMAQFKVKGGSTKSFRQNAPQYWRDEWNAIAEDVYAVFSGPLEEAIRLLLQHAGGRLAEAREIRRREGALEYDDLLSMTDELVRGNVRVRTRLHGDIKVMLIDEFQDTDPLQWELIRRITADPLDERARPLPGRLIVVGDPKQAIYSFRGADVNTYIAARYEFSREDAALGPVLHLSSNFRTVTPIIEWVNTVFELAMNSGTQVMYEALSAVHAPDHALPGPSVTVLRDPPIGDQKPNPRVIEAALIAGQIRRAVDEQWQVTARRDDRTRVYDRAASYRDMAVLYPTRSSLDALLNAFDEAGIPYRSSDAALIFDRPVVLGTIHALTAIADPSNELALWLALKTPLFGCTDADLVDYRQRGGRWNSVPGEEMQDNRAARALGTLAGIRRASGDSQPVHVMQELFRVTRVFEVLALTPRGNFDADALRMLSTHAQQWQDTGGLGLIQYIEMIEEMRTDGTRAQFPRPDDKDDDAIELMTVFAAKGLEFPLVFLAGMTTNPPTKRPMLGIVSRDRIEFSLNARAASTGYNDWHRGTYKRLHDEERMRVLYVACTRAMDHLVVSLCGETSQYTSRSHGALLRPHVAAVDSDVREAASYPEPEIAQLAQLATVAPDWPQRVEAARTASQQRFVAQPSGNAATALGLSTADAGPMDSVEPLEIDSSELMALGLRDGAAFGQCVHATMDSLISAGQYGRDAVEAAALASLSLVDTSLRWEEIADAVEAILATPIMVEALSAHRRWPELYLTTSTGTDPVGVVEGIADLVFEDGEGGFVVIDYKTDKSIDEESLKHYREQLACYAEMLQRVTGIEVARRVVVHVVGNRTEQITV